MKNNLNEKADEIKLQVCTKGIILADELGPDIDDSSETAQLIMKRIGSAFLDEGLKAFNERRISRGWQPTTPPEQG